MAELDFDALQRALLPTDEEPGGAKDHFRRRVEESKDFCTSIWEKSADNHKFAGKAGKHQWEESVWNARRDTGRPSFTISDTTLGVNALSGMEITRRFERTFVGQEGDDHRVAEALTKIDRVLRDKGHVEHYESDKFRDLGIEGYACIEMYQDFLDNPRGSTKVRGIDTWAMLWDSAARDFNLLDRMWDAVGRWMSIDEFLATHPEHRDRAERAIMKPDGWIYPLEHKIHRWPWLYVGDGRYVEPYKRDVFLVDYQWREREGVYHLAVPVEEMGPDGMPVQRMAIQTYSEEEWDGLLSGMVTKPDRKDYIRPEDGAYRWRYRQAKILGDEVLEEGPAPVPGFTRLWMTGFPFKQMESVEFQGLVDQMKDPQRFKNYVTSLLVSMLQRSPKGGGFYDPDAFDAATIDEMQKMMAQPFPMIPTKGGALRAGERIYEELRSAPFPNGLEAYLQVADQAVWRPTGMNPNVLGQLQDPRRVSGRVFSSLAEAGQMVMSYIFNSLRLYRQMSGILQLQFLKDFYDTDQLRQLAGPELAQYIPDQGSDQWDGIFQRDVMVDETAATTKDDRERAWEFLSRQGADRMVAAGILSKRTLVKSMPGISETDRAYELKRLDLEEGLEQLEAQLQQLQQQVAEAGGGAPQG